MNLNYPKLKVLLVGVGGIGCEILKMVSKWQFEELHIIDMDTIEVSNLNRQFLFRQEHRGQSKAKVAEQTMKKISPHIKIISHHAAINSPGYGLKFFQQFDTVIMALDNVETRSYVNKVCKALGIFFVDAGSMGFKGQSKAYYPEYSECYDCDPVAIAQKQYPACTIRSQPTTCVHCIIWAKYLFEQLFTETTKDSDSGILEINMDKTNPEEVFLWFFNKEIPNNKLDISDVMFTNRKVQPDEIKTVEQLQGMWFWAFNQLKGQLQVFEKDDPIHQLFIYSSTLLRCINFKIDPYDFLRIKTISGNIIHAIASTNSIVAALEILKLLFFMIKPAKTVRDLKGAIYYSTGKRERIISQIAQKRNENCNSCFQRQVYLEINFEIKLEQLVYAIKDFVMAEGILLYAQSRVIWDEEEEEQCQLQSTKPLSALFDQQIDNRILVKDIDDKLLMVLWLLNNPDQQEIQFHNTKKIDIKLKFPEPLIQNQRKVIQQQEQLPLKINLPVKPIVSIDLDDSDEIIID